jgi:peptidoglycan/LPS O-acetylase OafA/YrhL
VTLSAHPRTRRSDARRESQAPRRLEFLDALRGIAVGLVLVQHVGELLFPAVARLSTHGVQLGQLGVTVFFLCSGFIIPASLERAPAGTGRRAAFTGFWRSRLFRLFPMYWLSLAAAGLLVLAGRYDPPTPMAAWDWVANGAMVQMVTGRPHALSLYWTLAFEMVFYVAVSALFLLGLHRRSVSLSLLASAGCVVAALTAPLVLGLPAPTGLFCLATMFTGTVFHRWHSGGVRLGALVACVAATLVAGATLVHADSVHTGAAAGPGPVPMFMAWVCAYAVFCGAMALRTRTFPRSLRRLGTISYSVYLVQALVLLAVPQSPHPALTAVVWVGLTLVLSQLTHRYVELRAIALGRRLARRPASRQPVWAVPVPREPQRMVGV